MEPPMAPTTDPVIIVPIKPYREAKSRLGAVLPPEQRAMLSGRMSRHVLEIASGVVGASRLLVVSRCRDVLRQAAALGAATLKEESGGHNAALEQAMRFVASERQGPVLVLSSDLPWLGTADIAAMLDNRDGAEVKIATDLAGQGTNALYLARPGSIPMRFGPDSRYRHETAARLAGLRFTTVTRTGLARDVDLPADLDLPPAFDRRIDEAGAGLPL